MAKILIKNGPPEFDMIHAYFRQRGLDGRASEVEMTFDKEGTGMTNVCYVRLSVMIPWTDSTKTWKFRATVETKESRIAGCCHWKAFVGTYSFQTRQGEGTFVDGLGSLKDIDLNVGRDLSDIIRTARKM